MKTTALLLFLFFQLPLFSQSVIKISTGVSNSTGSLLPNYSLDDTWKVYVPGSSTPMQAMVSRTTIGWSNTPCAAWVTSLVGSQPQGDYTFETTFFISCNPTTASMTLSTYAADNTFVGIQINNHYIPFISGNADDVNFRYNYLLPNLMPYINNGANTLRFVVHNRPIGGSNSGTPVGLLICGQITTNATVINNPMFTLSVTAPPNQTYFYRGANPVITNANQVPGYGEMYIIEQMLYGGQVISVTSQGNNPNPPCWWVYPDTVKFKGYNGTQNVTNVSPCKLNGIGKFPQCYRYRITRGTWNSYCPWVQYSIITQDDLCDMRSGDPTNIPDSVDTNAPDFSYLKPGQLVSVIKTINESPATSHVFPNPGNGVFTLTTSKVSLGTIEVFDPTGVVIRRIELRNNKINTMIDLSNYPAGCYTARIITASNIITEKLVLVK